MKLLSASFAVACLAAQATCAVLSHRLNGFTITEHPDLKQRAMLQDIVSNISHVENGRRFKDRNLCATELVDYMGQPIALYTWRTDYDF